MFMARWGAAPFCWGLTMCLIDKDYINNNQPK
jgi:hypothetical protein